MHFFYFIYREIILNYDIKENVVKVDNKLFKILNPLENYPNNHVFTKILNISNIIFHRP